MATIAISRPQNWILGDEYPVKRDWLPDIVSEQDILIAEQNSDKYDFKSIFYSVGLCRERRCFYAVGPKLMNLADLVLPMSARFSMDGGVIFKQIDYKVLHASISFNVTIIEFYPDMLPDGVIDLELTLACGDTKLFTFDNQPKSAIEIVQNAHQKDNEIDWIVDWLNYYCSLGVYNFHIYDNGSDNFNELCKSIEDHTPNILNVKFTIWHYRFGLAQFNRSQFSQNASIIDFNYQTQHADWALNFDIDEYLVVDDVIGDLPNFLGDISTEIGNVQFGCSDAPLIKDLSYPAKVSVRDLNWRTKEVRTKFKNAFRPKITLTASIHKAKLMKGFKAIFPQKEPNFYLHARPLNTGWCAPARRREKHKLTLEKFTEELRVSDRMRRIDDPSNLDGLSLIHRVSDTPAKIFSDVRSKQFVDK